MYLQVLFFVVSFPIVPYVFHKNLKTIWRQRKEHKMINNHKRGEWREEVRYALMFYVDRYGGYAFPCDKDGNVLMDQMEEPARRNYADCLAHPEKYPYSFNEVHREESRYREPDTGVCHCGQKMYLTNEYMGACQCPECGQWYNINGQELLPPDEWGWDGTPIDAD